MTERRSLSLPPPLFAVVPAAGVGARMGAGLPKQYLTLQGRTLAEHTLGRLLAFAPLQAVQGTYPFFKTLAWLALWNNTDQLRVASATLH